ncbi:porin family protein [Undibacterium sp. Di27W]|uniref:porin family protein n=1 Tax=Undibacterium sp. Di27W TaxID=3413036 RepID=UPI003BF0B88F
MKLISISLASSLLVISLSASAADGREEQGFYAGLDVGKSSVSSKVINDGKDLIGGVNAGYQFNQNFAAEVFYRSMSFRVLDGVIGDKNYYPNGHIGIAAIGRVPVYEKLGVYGRLGIGQTSMKADSNSLPEKRQREGSYGIGADYQISPNFSLKLEATRFAKSEVTTTTIGAQYRF